MSGLKWTNGLGASFMFLTYSLFSGVVSMVSLTTNTVTVQEGTPFSLSCTKSAELLNVYWIRNKDIIFKTYSTSDHVQFDQATNAERYKDVSGRITVSTSLRRHNVTLRINSTLDDGSEWLCWIGGVQSNSIYINITQHTAVPSSSTSKATTVTFPELSSTNNILTTVAPSTGNSKENATKTEKSSNQNEKLIYIIAASAGGGVVVIVVVVVVCVVCARKRRTEKTPTKYTSQGGLHSVHDSQYDNNEAEMVDNVLYSSGYVDGDYSTVDAYTNTAESKAGVSDDTKVTDVYTRVQKRKEKTEVQVTVNIEDLYAKPVKKKKKKGEPSISVQNNVNISTGQIADEDV